MPGFVEKNYQSYAASVANQTMNILLGKESFLFRALNRLSKGKLKKHIMKKRYPKNSLLAILNRIECEAWQELTSASIKEMLKKDC